MPEAEVNLGTLNGSYGDVGYQGATESETAYIDRGADTQLICTKQLLHVYNFFQISREEKSLSQDCHKNW